MSQLLSTQCTCDQAIEQAIRLLNEHNLTTSLSFDLRSTSFTPMDCSCSHHGEDPCACNLVVLLVYSTEGRPATLVFHGHNEQTWIALDTSPAQRPASDLEDAIKKVLTPDAFSYWERERPINVA